jgi:hypothetical protein
MVAQRKRLAGKVRAAKFIFVFPPEGVAGKINYDLKM